MSEGNQIESIVYRFDGFLVDTGNFSITRDGEAITLAPRSYDVFRLLIENAGHVVEKHEIFDVIWKDTFVTDNALTKVVKELRHAIGDSAENPRYIETIPKRGYRFIGELISPIEAPAESETSTVSRPSAGRLVIAIAAVAVIVIALAWFSLFRDSADTSTTPKSIAVLPFKPLASDSRDESLELGMAETLVTRLSSLRDVVVRPIRSVRKFTDPALDPIQAGEELQVDAVLDGSIQRAGERVRVTAGLVDVRTGETIWSEQFDEQFADIFRMQDSLAQRIAGALALKLSRQEQEQLAKHMTESPAAYELYLRGQFHWHRRGPDWINQSLNAYKLALEEDPNFALAHIGLADAYIMLSGHRHMSMDEAEANAAPHIAKALQIDNSLAQAHNALAELKYQYQYDWAGAEAEFRTAIDLNPNIAWIRQAYGWFLMTEGRFDEANVEMERARQLDPSSLTLSVARGRLYYFSRQYDRAAQHYESVMAVDPTETSSYTNLEAIYARRGMYPEAFEMFMKWQGGSDPERNARLRRAFEAGGWEGFLRERLVRLDEVAARTNRPPMMNYANTFTSLGDKDNAFYWLEKLFDSRDVSILQFKIDPANDVLRDDPRFAALLAKIGQKP